MADLTASRPRGIRRRTVAAAALLSGGYLVVGLVYIHFSDAWAVKFTRSVEALALVQRVKGMGFIVLTALLLFLLAWSLMRRVVRQTRALVASHDALVNFERRASAGTLALALAHDANNLVTVSTGIAELLAAQKLDPAARDLVETLRKSIGELRINLERTQSIGRAAAGDRLSVLDLGKLARDTCALIAKHERVRRCKLAVTCGEGVLVVGNSALINAVLLNLVLNAADATQEKGSIAVRVARSEQGAILEVQDDGPGIPQDLQSQLFTPYFTTKLHGTGLGLMAARLCAEAHGGRVEFAHQPAPGACFRLILPLAAKEVRAPAAP